MDIDVHPIDTEFSVNDWNQFLITNPTRLFYFTREFLTHAETPWVDMSVVIKRGAEILAIFPCAWSRDHDAVVSHPGATFGSFHVSESLQPHDLRDVALATIRYFKNRGIPRLRIRVPPTHMTGRISEDITYTFFELGAKVVNPKLSAVISIEAPIKLASLRRRTLRRARASNLRFVSGYAPSLFDAYYDLLSSELLSRYGAVPVHSKQELLRLRDFFGSNIEIFAAYAEDAIVGGVLVFKYGNCWRFQYITSNDAGREFGAVDLVFDEVAAIARSLQVTWLDLGTSNGTYDGSLNRNLYQFKTGFGAKGVMNFDIELEMS